MAITPTAAPPKRSTAEYWGRRAPGKALKPIDHSSIGINGTGPAIEPKGIGLDRAARSLRDHVDGRGILGFPCVPLLASLPRDRARAATGGAGVDRIPQRGVLPVRPAVGAFLGSLGRAIWTHPDHCAKRIRRDGGLWCAVARAKPLAGGVWVAPCRISAWEHRRDVDGPSRRHPTWSGRVCDLPFRRHPIAGLRLGTDIWWLARRSRPPEPAHPVRPRRRTVACRRRHALGFRSGGNPHAWADRICHSARPRGIATCTYRARDLDRIRRLRPGLFRSADRKPFPSSS